MRILVLIVAAAGLLAAPGCGGEEQKCVPDCTNRQCGLDPVCGTLDCGSCPTGKSCNANAECVSEACVPDCLGRVCGMDPVCGTLDCGSCPTGENCTASGECVTEACVPDCQGRVCGMDPVCGTLDCGSCPAPETCNPTTGQCQGGDPTGCDLTVALSMTPAPVNSGVVVPAGSNPLLCWTVPQNAQVLPGPDGWDLTIQRDDTPGGSPEDAEWTVIRGIPPDERSVGYGDCPPQAMCFPAKSLRPGAHWFTLWDGSQVGGLGGSLSFSVE